MSTADVKRVYAESSESEEQPTTELGDTRMDTPVRTALQDLLMTWNGDKLELRTTSGKAYIGYSWLNHDMSLVFLNRQPGAEDGTAVVVDRIEAVRFLEAYPKADDLTAGDDRPGAVTEPENPQKASKR
jgi:hypothetical protein